MFILKITKALDKAKIDYAVVGGVALALHGVARGTMDLDLVIRLSLHDFEKIEEVLLELGFQSRIPVDAKMVFQFRKEYIENKNLLAWSFYNPKLPYEILDILLIHDLKKIKTKKIDVLNYKINVASIENLIAMKKQAGREQDLEDIKMLEQLRN